MEGYTSFTKQVSEALRAADRPGPVHMLNLIRLLGRAAYQDGPDATDLQAYEAYSRLSAPAFFPSLAAPSCGVGGELSLVGPPDTAWDITFIAEYPSPPAFVEMLRDPRYREPMAHRQAGVADSRLIRFSALPLGTSFEG